MDGSENSGNKLNLKDKLHSKNFVYLHFNKIWKTTVVFISRITYKYFGKAWFFFAISQSTDGKSVRLASEN